MTWLFPVSSRDLREYSPAVLAYIGDAVLELYTRAYLLQEANRPVRSLHQATVALVSAVNQAQVVEKIDDFLTEEEKEVLRRGRNSRDNSFRGGEARAHALSTGLEAVFGYLYLKGDQERLQELLTTFIRVSEEG